MEAHPNLRPLEGLNALHGGEAAGGTRHKCGRTFFASSGMTIYYMRLWLRISAILGARLPKRVLADAQPRVSAGRMN